MEAGLEEQEMVRRCSVHQLLKRHWGGEEGPSGDCILERLEGFDDSPEVRLEVDGSPEVHLEVDDSPEVRLEGVLSN